jgi:hypothetical protein
MVILVAYHPEIVAAELKIGLPETVAVFSLKTFGAPCLSRLSYGTVQSGFTDNPIYVIVVNGGAFMAKVACYLVWSPTVPFP